MGARCLDLGCGSGDVTFELARRTGPGGHVTGVDLDEVKIALARETAESMGLAHVEFHLGNVYEWGEPGGAMTSSTAATCCSISAVRSTSCAACGRASARTA